MVLKIVIISSSNLTSARATALYTHRRSLLMSLSVHVQEVGKLSTTSTCLARIFLMPSGTLLSYFEFAVAPRYVFKSVLGWDCCFSTFCFLGGGLFSLSSSPSSLT